MLGQDQDSSVHPIPQETQAQLDRIETMLKALSMSPTSLMSAKDYGQRLADVITKHGHGSPQYKALIDERNSQ